MKFPNWESRIRTVSKDETSSLDIKLSPFPLFRQSSQAVSIGILSTFQMDIVFHPGQNGSDPWVEFYPYTPSATAGYAFMGIFGVSTLVHIVLMFPYRAAYFIPLILGGICMNLPSPWQS